MKKLAFIITTLLISMTSLQSQTIHWLLFFDTNDEQTGELTIGSWKRFKSHFVNTVNAVLTKECGYTSNFHDIYGTHISPDKCIKEVQNLNCQPDDIIFFYYAGHGGRSVKDNTQWPQMMMGQHDLNKAVPLIGVYNELKKKGARLTIAVSMSCNSVAEGMSAKNTFPVSANYGPTNISQREIENIKSLFLNSKGNIIASSSKPGEYSIGNIIQGFGPMDYFTCSFTYFFEGLTSEMQSVTWEKIFENASAGVHQLSGNKQHPQYSINVTQASAPKPKPQPEPKQEESQKNNSSDDEENEMSKFLDFVQANLSFISSSANDGDKRTAVAERFAKNFDKKVMVRMLSQDNDQIIDKEDIQTFLDRISTSSLLYKVALYEIKVDDSGRILAMKVKEIYKE